jgi:hypothetical protein
MPIILATQEAEIRRINALKPARTNSSWTLSRKYLILKGLVEWLKVKALSLSPSTAKKKINKLLFSSQMANAFQHFLDSVFIYIHLILWQEYSYHCWHQHYRSHFVCQLSQKICATLRE